MEHAQRATIAFLCGCLHDKDSSVHSGLHDYMRGVNVAFSYVNNGGNVSIFDYGRKCYLTGRCPSFYDYGALQYVSLTMVNDNQFSVFDYHTSAYMSVTCHGKQVSVFDYEKGQYFNYQLT